MVSSFFCVGKEMKNRMQLPPKRKAFADYYMQTGNASESYKMAGYCIKNNNVAGVEGNRLLNNPKVQAYIQEKSKPISEKRIADMRQVQEFWTDVIMDEDENMQNRLKASELIAKVQGAFLNRVDLQGATAVQIIDDIPEVNENA